MIDFLYIQKTVNVSYYCHLLDDVRATHIATNDTSNQFMTYCFSINARPHTAAQTRNKLTEIHWTSPLEHSPYSPDLPPYDFHKFGVLKEVLGEEKFNNDAEVKQYVCNWLLEYLSSIFDRRIKKLHIQWRK